MSTGRGERGARGGKGAADEKQGKLVIEKGDQGKKVSFRGTHGLGDVEVREEIRKEIRKELRQEIAEWKKEMESRMKEFEGRMIIAERFIEESKQREMREEMSGSEGENSEECESRAASSRFSSRTRYSCRYGSIRSVDRLSECLSEREIGKIKKFVVEKEKEERRGNIVIKGWEIEDKITKAEFIKKELNVEVKVKRCRISGKVIVVSLDEEGDNV